MKRSISITINDTLCICCDNALFYDIVSYKRINLEGIKMTQHAFRAATREDFERMLNNILEQHTRSGANAATQAKAELTAVGHYGSGRAPFHVESKVSPEHEGMIDQTMRLIIEFASLGNIEVRELSQHAGAKLKAATAQMLEPIQPVIEHLYKTMPNNSKIYDEIKERFERRLANALQNVEIGFVGGQNVAPAPPPNIQRNALKLLTAIYNQRHGQDSPTFIDALNTGMSQQEAQEAWRYLKGKRLIETFSVDYTARINAHGVDVIENAGRHPDQSTSDFPSVTYNNVVNNVTIGTANNSPIQQAGPQANQNQSIAYNAADISNLTRLMDEFTTHLDELNLATSQKRKAEVQIATIQTQLIDEPNPTIVKEAGRTLRNITEGAIGGLITTGVQTEIWPWIQTTMAGLF
jgi:hypothetical protein